MNVDLVMDYNRMRYDVITVFVPGLQGVHVQVRRQRETTAVRSRHAGIRLHAQTAVTTHYTDVGVTSQLLQSDLIRIEGCREKSQHNIA